MSCEVTGVREPYVDHFGNLRRQWLFEGTFNMKTSVSAILVAATLVGSMMAAPAAHAQRGLGVGIAAGLLGGAIVGGAIASSRPGYAAPAPVYVDEGPACRLVRQRYIDQYGYERFRRVEVCN